MDITPEFESSELGTKKYWEQIYLKELENFQVSGDIGDIWFGEDSVIRIINWIKTHISSLISLEDPVLDIGCGNGILLSYLVDEGFKNVYGIDYSEKAISLAKAVAEKRGTNVRYEIANIITGECDGDLLSKKYKICLDKGTYDAISLCPVNPSDKMKAYINNIYRMLNKDGLLIITSCNWTEDELYNHFQNCKHKTSSW